MSTQTDQSTSGPDEQEQVQNPLTLVMALKSAEAAAQLRATLLQGDGLQNEIDAALNELQTVHFARFVLLDGEPPKLAVITSYDDRFEDYIMSFTHRLGPIFDLILTKFVADAPATPVRDNAREFVEYVRSHDLRCVGSFYSAYPLMRVPEIVAAADAGS